MEPRLYTMLSGSRPTFVPSGIFIHPAVWPQYTNVTDRWTDRERSDNVGRTVFWATICKTIRLVLLDCCLSVCLSVLSCPFLSCLFVLSVTFVHCGQTVARIKMKHGMHVGLGPGHTVLDLDPAPPPQRGTAPQFSAHICCGQMAAWIKMSLGMELGRTVFWATVCKTVRPMLPDRCLSVCLSCPICRSCL